MFITLVPKKLMRWLFKFTTTHYLQTMFVPQFDNQLWLIYSWSRAATIRGVAFNQVIMVSHISDAFKNYQHINPHTQRPMYTCTHTHVHTILTILITIKKLKLIKQIKITITAEKKYLKALYSTLPAGCWPGIHDTLMMSHYIITITCIKMRGKDILFYVLWLMMISS